jgi:filamentous hemagglutinin family protein
VTLWGLLLQSALCPAQGIVPDGGSATSVSTAASGKQTVRIAPAAGGISHNTYTQFNVGKRGADLINNGVNARLILNEVTSTNPSLLQGAIAIVGPRAHFILANPNGITVDGGSFVNTGNVALSTGRVSFKDFDPGDGSTQRNVVLTTNAGRIDIGAQGLSGAFNTLELIAKNIRVGGAVTSTASTGRTRLVAGDSVVEFNSAIDGFDAVTPWTQHQSLGGAAPGTLAVDITALGSLSAGRVEILVADTGAGVRHAGSALASFGDFSLSSTGDIEIAGGSLRAARDVVIEGSALRVHSAASAPRITADGNVELRVGQASLESGTLTAGASGQTGSVVVGIAGTTASGPLHLGHELVSGAISRFTLSASGGVALESAGQPLEIDAAQVFAQQNITLDAAALQMNAAWLGSTPFAAQVQTSAGQVLINMAGSITSTGSNIHGTQGLSARADALTLQASVRGDRLEESSWVADAAAIDLGINRDIHLVGSDLLAQTHLAAQSTNLVLEAEPQTGRRSSAIAATGGLVAIASGAIRNSGSLLQGESRIAIDTRSLGSITLRAGGDIVNESTASDRISAIFGRGDDVVLHAGGDIVNRSARVLSNSALLVEAGGDVQNIVDKIAGANGEARQAFSRHETALLFFSRRVSGYDQDFGRLVLPGQLAYLIGNGDVTIRARNVVSQGGEIDANAGSLSIEAAQRISNEALRTGSLHYESRCLVMCSKSARSTVTLTGGSINAAHGIHLTAGTEIVNSGGRILALDDLLLDAPTVIARAVPTYSALGVSGGLSGDLGSAWGRVYAADQGGSFTANRGRLIVNGAVVIDGGSLAAGGGVTVRDGVTSSREASRDPIEQNDHLGLFDWLW